MDHRTPPSFERFAALRLRQDGERITREWIGRLSARLGLDPHDALPHPGLLDHLPVVLEKAAEFLLVPEPERLTAEQVVIEEMRDIARLRHRQGWDMQEVVREFDELAQILDAAALRWVAEYPGTPDAASVGIAFGRLNRVPLLMGQVMVAALEAERGNLLQQLATAEEEERKRLSRELHDQIGQLTTALSLGLRSLAHDEPVAERAARLRELERLADRIAREAQGLALNLRPPALDDLGLRLALEDFAAGWAEQTGVQCDIHCGFGEDERFAPEVETALYRVAQEGLNNVLKHAGATRVSLVLERRGRFLRLILEDDGAGFDVDRTLAAPEKSKRLGVRGMRERVGWLGGSLEIESSPGAGTTLYARVPIDARRHAGRHAGIHPDAKAEGSIGGERDG